MAAGQPQSDVRERAATVRLYRRHRLVHSVATGVLSQCLAGVDGYVHLRY